MQLFSDYAASGLWSCFNLKSELKEELYFCQSLHVNSSNCVKMQFYSIKGIGLYGGKAE